MQLFSTTDGIARREGDALAVLDSPYAGVHEAVLAGAIDELRTAATRARIAYDDATLLVPVRPDRLGQVGLNYRSHVEEIGRPVPDSMIYALSPLDGALGAPDADITLPADAPDHVDHECEIALVIGVRCAGVAADDAWDVIAGITACNDVSARDVQRDGLARGETTAGKMLPGFKPFGPGLLTVDAVRDGPIAIRLTVNGTERQSSDTTDMIHPIPDIIASISAEHELVPGDVIITGSPAGVGAFEQRFLTAGDVTEVFVGDLPPLRNTFVSASATR